MECVRFCLSWGELEGIEVGMGVVVELRGRVRFSFVNEARGFRVKSGWGTGGGLALSLFEGR